MRKWLWLPVLPRSWQAAVIFDTCGVRTTQTDTLTGNSGAALFGTLRTFYFVFLFFSSLSSSEETSDETWI